MIVTIIAALTIGVSGCATVKMKQVRPDRYIEAKRGDALTSAGLSAATRQASSMLDLSDDQCRKSIQNCAPALQRADGVSQEEALAATAELWIAHAIRLGKKRNRRDAEDHMLLSAWLEAARFSYAYLFFSERPHSARSLEDRQTQVRDYYNYAVEQAVTQIFAQMRDGNLPNTSKQTLPSPEGWSITLDLSRLGKDVPPLPESMLAASSLGFRGIRNQYRRDGFGAEMVAVMPVTPIELDAGRTPGIRPGQLIEMHTPNVTLILRFEGHSLAEVLDTRAATLNVLDPLIHADIELGGQTAVLAANYTAGYGVWLARAGFGGHSIRTLLGLRSGLDRSRLYMLQPYDPEREILLLIHGLASSPEAWVNLANDVLGDQELRKRYQIWLVYYPTSLPLAYNHMVVRATVRHALDHLDPERDDPASRKLVLVGHSMGGLIARLMVSSSEGRGLWNKLDLDDLPNGFDRDALKAELDPLLTFEPMPEVEAVMFIATPHRGTPKADGMLATLVRSLSKAPLALLDHYRNTAAIASDVPDRLPLSIDNLRATDPFIIAAAQLPMRPGLEHHSIIARRKPWDALAKSSDGVVPYESAHLTGAWSETVVTDGHSAQENPLAILVLRKILRQLR